MTTNPHAPNKVWVTDIRKPNDPPFLHEEHLLKFSKYLKPAPSKAKVTKRVQEPATSHKKEEKK